MITSERFTELYERYWSVVFCKCRDMLRSEQDAEDAAMDVFVNKWKSIHRYDPGRSFEAWLRANARNHCISLLRRRTREAEWLAGVDIEQVEVEPLFGLVETLALDACLERLAPLEREALIMKEVERMTWEEIAVVLQTTVARARGLVRKAGRELSRCLGEP